MTLFFVDTNFLLFFSDGEVGSVGFFPFWLDGMSASNANRMRENEKRKRQQNTHTQQQEQRQQQRQRKAEIPGRTGTAIIHGASGHTCIQGPTNRRGVVASSWDFW